MIPKKIHYCWFGPNQPSALVNKCVASWKKYLPDYELFLWNEDTYDLNKYAFTKEAYEQKKYAYVTDVVRLDVLKEYGGVYLDSDVEILKPLGDLLELTAFSGFEDNEYVPTGLMASEKGGRWVSDLLTYYENIPFVKPNREFNMITNTQIITEFMVEKNLVLNNQTQEFKDYVKLYSSEFFCPKSHKDGRLVITANSYCIHHFAGSWLPQKKRLRIKIVTFMRRMLGNNLFDWLKEKSYLIVKRN
jgi:mannosyltransferase OCH1-like enzyme